MRESRYIISELDNGNIQYRLVSKNGKTILTSKIHKDVSYVLKEIKKTHNCGNDMKNFNFLYTRDNEMYFTLTKDSKLIAKSNRYKTEHGLIKGCNTVMDNCQTSTIQYNIK